MINKRLPLAMCLILAACSTPQVIKDAAPPISKQVGKQKAPDEQILPIIKSEAIAADSQKAVDNYRKLLELTPDDDTKSESKRRLADLQVQIEDAKGNDASSSAGLRDAMRLYNELLYANPEDKNNDRVFYQLARAQQNSGNVDAAIDTLERLTKRHTESRLAGDAHFRRAELLFNTKRYAEAEAEYKTVMDLAEKTPFYESAQYKFGWSRYKQFNYDGALDVFIAILDRELPQGELYDTTEALKDISKSKNDLVRDSLRVTSYSLVALGGGKGLNEYLTKKAADPRFYPLLYSALGESLFDKERYSDAADTYAAFIERYPLHARSPAFQARIIQTYADGGFNDLVIREKERYATVYDPAATYWAGKQPTEEVLNGLRIHMLDLAKFYQARGQADKVKNQPDFLVSAKWYRRTMEVFPNDANVPELNFMLGDVLLDGGKTLEAAQEYSKTAYGYGLHPKAADAGYAAVLAYEQVAKDSPAEQRPAALRQTIDSGVKFADTFPGHTELMPVLTRMAEALYELKSYDEAIKVASRVLKSSRAVAYQLRRSAWGVTADSQFALKNYPDAETAYAEELKLTAKDSASRPEIIEQIAASVYKQGEAARTAGNLREAAEQFLRVSIAAPESKIRPTAEYDGAAALIQLEDWPAAQKVLEGFLVSYPGHTLGPDVDKKLAVAYQKDNKPLQAAQVYRRIFNRKTETVETRREAGWLAATLFDEAKSPADAASSYEAYVISYPRPLARSMEARGRLADYSRERGDTVQLSRWLRDIIYADDNAGTERTEKSRSMAARSAMELARFNIADAKQIRLTIPVESSLPRKKAAMDAAIQSLAKAGSYGYSDINTAATFELGGLYQDFGKAMLTSDRPRLGALELEQYNLLLEEQAFPFEEKAIETYETNLKRIRQSVYDEWVAKSYTELLKMAPAKYGKHEKGEEIYETLK